MSIHPGNANIQHDHIMQEAADKNTTPKTHVKPSENIIRRFESKFERQGPTPDPTNPHYAGLGPCWDWKAHIGINGYGYMYYGGLDKRPVAAHRLSYAIYKGDIPSEAFVLHRCDRRCCVNPDHLVLGDHDTNMVDKMVKGRAGRGEPVKHDYRASGEKNGHAKLRECDVREARFRRALGGVTFEALAAEYGVTRKSLENAVKGKTWKCVDFGLTSTPQSDIFRCVSPSEIAKEIVRRNPNPPKQRATKGVWVHHAWTVRHLVEKERWGVSDAVREVIKTHNLHPPDKAFTGIRAATYVVMKQPWPENLKP
jgi:hypothetical protein